MSLNRLLAILVAFFAVGAAALWAVSHLEFKEVEHVVPPSPIVRADPFYALSRIFSPTLKVVRYRDAAKISLKKAVLFAVNGRELDKLNEQTLARWMAQGGRLLIYFTDPSAHLPAKWWRGPFKGLAPRFGKPAGAATPPSKKSASSKPGSQQSDEAVLIDGRVYFPEASRGGSTSVVEYRGDAYAVVRRWGRGLVIVSGEPLFLMNGNLREKGNLQFTSAVLGDLLSRPGGVVLLPAPGTSLAAPTAHPNTGPMLIALLMLFVLLVWMRSPRLGPILPESSGDTRSLRSRFRAEGRFLWRYGVGRVIQECLATGRSLQDSSPGVAMEEDPPHAGSAAERRTPSREEFTATVADFVAKNTHSRNA